MRIPRHRGTEAKAAEGKTLASLAAAIWGRWTRLLGWRTEGDEQPDPEIAVENPPWDLASVSWDPPVDSSPTPVLSGLVANPRHDARHVWDLVVPADVEEFEDPLVEIDEYLLLGAIDEFLREHLRGWETPTQLLGIRYAPGNRCPGCGGRLVMRLPRIYSARVTPGGPIVDLAGAPLSVQTRLVGIGLTSVIRHEVTED